MAFKLLMFTTLLAYAYAGGLPLAAAPVAYSPANAVSSSFYTTGPVAAVAHAAPVAIHAPAVGSSQQTVLRGLGGSQAVSHYSKAVDSAFSSVRKYDTRITNDALRVAHAPVVAAPAYAAHAYAAPAYATHSYAAPAYATHSYAAPAYATQAYAAPAYAAQTYAAPAYATHSYASPVVAHAGPAVVAKSAPVAVAYSPAGLVSHVTFSGYGVNYGW